MGKSLGEKRSRLSWLNLQIRRGKSGKLPGRPAETQGEAAHKQKKKRVQRAVRSMGDYHGQELLFSALRKRRLLQRHRVTLRALVELSVDACLK